MRAGDRRGRYIYIYKVEIRVREEVSEVSINRANYSHVCFEYASSDYPVGQYNHNPRTDIHASHKECHFVERTPRVPPTNVGP